MEMFKDNLLITLIGDWLVCFFSPEEQPAQFVVLLRLLKTFQVDSCGPWSNALVPMLQRIRQQFHNNRKKREER